MVAASLDRLAHLHIALGRAKSAESLYDEAEAILVESLGQNSPALSGIYNNKALLLLQLERTSDAELLFKRAAELLISGAGKETPALAIVLSNLGNLYEATGRQKEAVKVRQQSATIFRKIYGDTPAPVVPPAILPAWQEL
jgi:tetratricopeptide (TPR) repeat protein